MTLMKMKYVCLQCQKDHDQFHEKCPHCGDEMASHLCYPDGVRYGCLTVMTDCPHCANPLPLNGPVLETVCIHCQKKVEFEAEMWKGILEEVESDYHLFGWGDSREMTTIRGSQTFKIEYGKQFPHCPECHKTMKPEEIEVGNTQKIPCRKCGQPIVTRPAPEWLKKVVPSAVQLYAVEELEVGEIESTDSDRPVVMNCPQCGAGLKITKDCERVTPCQFCDADVYLPDGLWLKLHPAKTVKRWEIRFEGGQVNQAAEEAGDSFFEPIQEEPTPVRPAPPVPVPVPEKAEPEEPKTPIPPILYVLAGLAAALLAYVLFG